MLVCLFFPFFSLCTISLYVLANPYKHTTLAHPHDSLYPEAAAPALDLLEKLLHWDPSKRPTAAEALSHPYFDDIRDADFEQVRTACEREGL